MAVALSVPHTVWISLITAAVPCMSIAAPSGPLDCAPRHSDPLIAGID